jgi:protease-4
MAKIKKNYTLREYPEKKNFLENLMQNYTNEVKIKTVKEEIGVEQYTIMQQLKNIRNLIGIPQTRLPFEFNIR